MTELDFSLKKMNSSKEIKAKVTISEIETLHGGVITLLLTIIICLYNII